jgi:hypothetical protein
LNSNATLLLINRISKCVKIRSYYLYRWIIAAMEKKIN